MKARMTEEFRNRKSAVALLRNPRSSANAFEVAVERLGSSIKMGLFTPGEQLPTERELSDIMNVSRTTVREAIRVLTVQGKLEVRRGRTGGTFVSTSFIAPSAKEQHAQVQAKGTVLLEILDLRLIVEPGIAELAAERANAEMRQRISELALQGSEAVDDFPSFRALDTQFHFLLARATGVQRLSAILGDIHAELSDLMTLIPHSVDACRHSSEQHKRIARAIAREKPEAARKAMKEHVGATTSLVKGLLG
jgi:GntR family transcriptional repressor for pyruvate dehydrogenase complex